MKKAVLKKNCAGRDFLFCNESKKIPRNKYQEKVLAKPCACSFTFDFKIVVITEKKRRIFEKVNCKIEGKG